MASPGQKVVLITGCSSGIGLSIAVKLAKDKQKRYHVIATMRDLKRKDKLVEAAGDAYGTSLSVAALDVCSDESVKQCINGIKDRHVDVLSIGLVGPLEGIPMEEMKKVFETNFYGMVRVIKEVMPDMKKRHGGHIIVMSSVMGLHGVVFNDVYAASKFAIEGFCECLAVQLLNFNVTLSLMEPGPVHTQFEIKMIQEVQQKEWPGADPHTVHDFNHIYLPSCVDLFEALGQTPDYIAKCTKEVIEARRPLFRNLTNPMFAPIIAMKFADQTGGLSVHAFYHFLFTLGPLQHVTMSAIKYLSFGCLRSGAVAPQ